MSNNLPALGPAEFAAPGRLTAHSIVRTGQPRKSPNDRDKSLAIRIFPSFSNARSAVSLKPPQYA
jgi:hypothetical protein